MNGQIAPTVHAPQTSRGSLLVAHATGTAREGLPEPSNYSPRSSQEQRLLDALATVVDPCSIATGVPISIADMGLVRDIVVASGTATIKLRLTNPFCFQIGIICEAIEKKIEALDLACVIEVDPVEHWSPELMSQDARDRLRRKREV